MRKHYNELIPKEERAEGHHGARVGHILGWVGLKGRGGARVKGASRQPAAAITPVVAAPSGQDATAAAAVDGGVADDLENGGGVFL